MSNNITAQQILVALKEIKGALVGISRVNKPLFVTLTKKVEKLEKAIITSCDKVVMEIVAEDTPSISAVELLRVIKDDSTSDAEVIGTIVDMTEEVLNANSEPDPALHQETNNIQAAFAEIQKAQEDIQRDMGVSATETGQASGVDNSLEAQHESDEDLLEKAAGKDTDSKPVEGNSMAALLAGGNNGSEDTE